MSWWVSSIVIMAVCAASVACWPRSSAAVETRGSQAMRASSVDCDVLEVSRGFGGASSRTRAARSCHAVLYYFSTHVAVCGTHGESNSLCQRPFESTAGQRNERQFSERED